jgi:cytochrome c oxidase subunit 3
MHTTSTSATLDDDQPLLMSHFDDLQQQHDASNLGMWCFLATEVMFFSGMLVAYAIYRSLSPEAFRLGSDHMHKYLGFFNTFVLLTSSFTMALGVRASQLGRRNQVVLYLVATAVLGVVFLGVKAVEYTKEINHELFPGKHFVVPTKDAEALLKVSATPEELHLNLGRFQMMFVLYFCLTAVHAFHMIIGIAIVLIMAELMRRRWFSGYGTTQIEVLGLYWHFVDVVWVFLYPLLYLIA